MIPYFAHRSTVCSWMPRPICHLLLVQHSSLAKPIIARAEAVGVHEIRYALGRKAISRLGLVALIRPGETLVD